MFRASSTKSVLSAMTIFFLLAGGQIVYAQDSQQADRFMQEFDQNQDGSISRDEYPGSDDAFVRLDADGNDTITATEVQKSLVRKRKSGGNFIVRFDADKDGKVSKDEFSRSDEQFARLDTNKDGYITEDEVPAGQGRGGRGPRGGGRPPLN